MASPQVENGHTQIANELLEALARIRIPGEARQVLDVIIRKTYGFHKKEDWISLKTFCNSTMLSKPAVCRAINNLRLKNIIKTYKLGVYTIFSINKNYITWSKAILKYDREEIFKRDNYTCIWCKKRFNSKNLEVDHIVPLVEGGSNKEKNLATSCSECNKRRGMESAGINKKVTVTELLQLQKKGVSNLRPTKEKDISSFKNNNSKKKDIASKKKAKKSNGYVYTIVFKKFWAEYPNKKEKDVAFGVFKNLKKEEQEQVVIAARNYRIETAKKEQDKEFIKHPATFLRKNRWKDYSGSPEKDEMEEFDEMQKKALESK